ncbi:hypothetical protein Bbelb_235230, partial [Branchiostoma belcheri]
SSFIYGLLGVGESRGRLLSVKTDILAAATCAVLVLTALILTEVNAPAKFGQCDPGFNSGERFRAVMNFIHRSRNAPAKFGQCDRALTLFMENHAFEVLRIANQTYQEIDFFVIEARLPADGQSGSQNWCNDYKLLCAKYGLKPTGCGNELMDSVADVDRDIVCPSPTYSYSARRRGGQKIPTSLDLVSCFRETRCVNEYNSDPNINDVLGCHPADGVAQVAKLAFPSATVTRDRSFGFYRCSTNYCQRGITESRWSLTYTTDAVQPGDGIVYTVCKGLATAQCPLLTAPTNGAKEGSNYYQDVVSFTCDVGYELGGEASATCQADGTWSVADPPTCTVVQCPQMVEPANGAITSTGNNLYGDEVSFRCDSGYEPVGETNIICQADGTWTNAATCTDINGCSPNPCHLKATCEDVTAPGTGATCTCQNGYEGDGVLDGTGCTAVQCPLPILPHGIGMTGSNSYPNDIHFFCHTGPQGQIYLLHHTESSSCQADGTWSHRIPDSEGDCQGHNVGRMSRHVPGSTSWVRLGIELWSPAAVVQCRELVLPPDVIVTSGTDRQIDSEWTFACEDGYEVFPYDHLTCGGHYGRWRYLSDGQWELPAGDVVDPVCRDIRLEGNKDWRGRVEIYREGEWGTICKNGWDENDAEVACRRAGFPGVQRALIDVDAEAATGEIWMDEVDCSGTEANLKDCNHVGKDGHSCTHAEDVAVECIAHGHLIAFSSTGREALCKAGVTFETELARHVVGGDAGRRHQAERAPARCTRLGRNAFELFYGTFGSPGPYALKNPGRAASYHTGRNTRIERNRGPTRECPDEGPDHLFYWFNTRQYSSTIGSSHLYQDVVHFTCDPGYELIGAPSVECQADGEWTILEEEPRCSEPTYNSEARFWCDPGFTLGGESTITCQADGTWSGDAPVCTDTDGCSPNPCHSMATCKDNLAPAPGGTCTCELGYEGDGQDAGSGCTAVRCPQPTSPDNGDMSGSYSYPEEVTFTCNAGYQLVGAQTVTCRHDRTWSDSFPTCTDIDGCSPNPCHPKATCEDVTAPGTGATCTCDRENGYEGDGVLDGTGCTGQLHLTFTEVTLDHVTMSWTVPDDLTIMGYHVRYEHAGGFYQELSPPPTPDNTTVTVSGLWADTEYTFTVTSFGEGGEENGRGNGTTTTAKVVVNVECSQGTMKVSIPLAGLPNVNVDNMHLLDPKCKATVGPTYVSLETGLKDCGTIEQANMENDKFIFMNEAIADPVTLANGAVRGTSFRRRFQCEFHRQFVISQGREVMYNIPSPSVEIVDADDVLTFNLNMFTSEDFSTMYDSSDFPLRMTPSDRLHFGLSLDSSLNVLELFALHCVATPTTDPNSDPKVSIIQDGCLVDPTLLMDSTRSNDMAMYFSVDAFTIPNADDSRLVYFHCTMLVCLKDDPDSRCNGGCIPSSRRKRALTDSREIRVRRESISERKANISQGPIIVEETQEAGTAFPTIGVAMGTVGGFLGVLLLVAALGRGRKKRHQNIEEMTGRRIGKDVCCHAGTWMADNYGDKKRL